MSSPCDYVTNLASDSLKPVFTYFQWIFKRFLFKILVSKTFKIHFFLFQPARLCWIMKVSSIGLWNIPELPATWKISKINSRLFSSSSPTSFSLFQSERGNRSVWGCGPWGSFQMRGAFLQYSLTGPCNHAEISHLQFGDSCQFQIFSKQTDMRKGKTQYLTLFCFNIVRVTFF